MSDQGQCVFVIDRRTSLCWRRARTRTGFTWSSSFCPAFQRWWSQPWLCTNSSGTGAVHPRTHTPASCSTPSLTKYRYSPTRPTVTAWAEDTTHTHTWGIYTGLTFDLWPSLLQFTHGICTDVIELFQFLLFVCIYAKWSSQVSILLFWRYTITYICTKSDNNVQETAVYPDAFAVASCTSNRKSGERKIFYRIFSHQFSSYLS